MGTKTLKRILRHKHTSERKETNAAKRNFLLDRQERRSQRVAHKNDAEITTSQANIPFQERSTTGSLVNLSETPRNRRKVGNIIRGTGNLILRQFIATLGSDTEASLNRGWVAGGTTLQQGTEYSYVLRQGRDGQEEQIRSLLRGRLYRSGHRLQGGGWTRLILGDEFMSAPSRKQMHELQFIIPYCACVACRVDSARGEARDDMDEMLAEAEQGGGFFDENDAPVQRAIGTAERNSSRSIGLEEGRRRTTFSKLPSVEDLRRLGETLPSQELELGTVSKINSRGGKVTFSPFARQFFIDDRYTGPMSMREVSEAVLEHAAQHYRQHRGKTTRRFYVHGWVSRFAIDATGAVIFPSRIEGPVGVLFRRQAMTVLQGRLALEDAFGSLLFTAHEIFLGFGEDESGAQSILPDGSLDLARHLGINELRMHCAIDAGEEVEVRMT